MLCCVYLLKSYLTLCNPGTVARQAPLTTGFSGQEHWSGLPLPPPGDLPNSGIKPRSRASCRKHWQASSLPLGPPGKPKEKHTEAT